MNEITAHLISIPAHIAPVYFAGDDLFDLQEMLALADGVPVAIVTFA